MPTGDICTGVITGEPKSNGESLVHHLAVDEDLRGVMSQPLDAELSWTQAPEPPSPFPTPITARPAPADGRARRALSCALLLENADSDLPELTRCH